MDVDYAQKCMAESAYPNGFSVNVVTMDSDAPIWEVVKDCLSKLNIDVSITTYDMATCIATSREA